MKRKNSYHGDSYSRLYRIYQKIKARCYDKKQAYYHLYGGSGIKMCSVWRNSYVLFREWAIQNGYEEHLTIDRIDNRKDYCPKNCRWATTKEQARNKRNNVVFMGECALDASLRLSDSRALVVNRIALGWSKEDAFTKPLQNRGRNTLVPIKYVLEKLNNGSTQFEIAKALNVTQSCISRIKSKHGK